MRGTFPVSRFRLTVKILFLLLALATVNGKPSTAVAANRMWWATCITGGGDCLDGIDVSGLTDGDGGIVAMDNGGTPQHYVYRLKNYVSGPPTADGLRIVSPATNPGNMRWLLSQSIDDGSSTAKQSGVAGQNCVFTSYLTDVYGICVEGPDDHRTANLLLKYPDGVPAESILIYPVPTSNRSVGTWAGVGFGANQIPRMAATPGTPDGTKFVADDGTLKTPAGTIGGSAGSTDKADLRASGTGGATIQSSPCTTDDAGNKTCTSYSTPQAATSGGTQDQTKWRGYGTNGRGFYFDNPAPEPAITFGLHLWTTEPTGGLSIPYVVTFGSHAGQWGWLTGSANSYFGVNDLGVMGFYQSISMDNSTAQFFDRLDPTKKVLIDPSNQTTGHQGAIQAPDGDTAVLVGGTMLPTSKKAAYTDINTGSDDTEYITPVGLKQSYVATKDVGWNIVNSDTATATGEGKQAYAVPASLNGGKVVDFTCSVYALNSATGGSTTVMLRRSRAGSDAEMFSSGAAIAYNAYTANVSSINDTYAGVLTGDLLFVDIDSVTTGAAQKGLYCTALFRLP